MKLTAGHKVCLFLALIITVAVFCTLPFLFVKKDTLYIYTDMPQLNTREKGFIRELKQLGFNVIVNDKRKVNKNADVLWLSTDNLFNKINQSKFHFNFIYTEDFYPLDWQELKNPIIVLTPYQTLYEHYMRSNVPTAKMQLGVDISVFYAQKKKKKYPIVYYGEQVKNRMENSKNICFMGPWVQKKIDSCVLPYDDDKQRSKALTESKIVIVDNDINTSAAQKVPSEIMEAAASGALVLTTPNKSVQDIYGSSIIIYNSEDELQAKIKYYLSHPDSMIQSVTAQKITAEKLSSKASAQRFYEIWKWLKENRETNFVY